MNSDNPNRWKPLSWPKQISHSTSLINLSVNSKVQGNLLIAYLALLLSVASRKKDVYAPDKTSFGHRHVISRILIGSLVYISREQWREENGHNATLHLFASNLGSQNKPDIITKHWSSHHILQCPLNIPTHCSIPQSRWLPQFFQRLSGFQRWEQNKEYIYEIFLC